MSGKNEKRVREVANSVVFEIQERQDLHNPYSQELREQESIRTGNTEALKICWEEKYDGEVGVLSDNYLRSVKNIAVGVITLSSRSAIEGGLSPELAFSMADGFIKDIEDNIDKPEQVIDALHEAQLGFAEAVRSIGSSGGYNPFVRRAKDYISRHMHDKITVAEMAAEIGVNADYLSALFSKTEKKTITQYILGEKMLMCENMLKYSEYSIQEISAYFAFSSQSHFTKLFREVHGITPSEYRKIYKRDQ